jgi:transposase InsO family protein
MNHAEWERHADDVALARYSVISPLVCRQMGPADRLRTKQEILASVHLFPDGKSKMVSRRCLERWCKWYEKGHINEDGELVTEPGIEALRPIPRHDNGVPRVLDEEIVSRAIDLRREEPSRNTAALIELLQAEAARRGEELPAIQEATLAYHLRKRQATKKDLKKEARAFPRYEQPRRNATWQGDWTQGIMLSDPSSPNKPRLCHLHAFLDDYSRYVVHAEFYFRQNLPCLEDCFRKAIVHGGIPERAYWDNGAVYQSRQVRLIAARLGTEAIFATPYHPEGKGKIERWFRTCKDAFYPEAKRAGLQSLAELNEFFWGWLERYNNRVHSETKESPVSRWESGAAGVRYPDPADLVDLFLWEEVRVVDKSGCIHLGGNAYPVAEHLVGRQVTVRFDPFDLSRLRLYENGHFSYVLEPQTLVSRTYRKALPKEKKRDAALESSGAYRDQLSRNFRDRVDETLQQTRGHGFPCLSQPEFLRLLQEALSGRQLSAAEGKWAVDFFARNAPLAARLVQAGMQKAVEAKGTSRHIRYYLDSIQDARLEDRGA